MKVVSKTDFDKTLNLPQKTIDTEAEIVKRDNFFIESLQDGSKFNTANEKNRVNNSNVNISEIPMPISEKIAPTSIINKVLKDVIARYSILKGNYVDHSLGFYHTDEMLKRIKEKQKENSNNNDSKENKKTKTNSNATKSTNFSHIRKEFGIVEKNKATLEGNIRKQIYEVSNLGSMINYSQHNYSTLKLNVNHEMLEKFGTLYEKGLIHSEKRPVSWCTNCGISANQKDIKYRKSKVKNTYFLCKIKNDDGKLSKIVDLKNTYLVVSTIRPWILLNTGKLITAKDSKFSVVKVVKPDETSTYYIIASNHVKHVMDDAFFIKYEVIHEFDSNLFDNVIASNPLKIEKNLPIYLVNKKFVDIDENNLTGINLIGNVDSYLDHLVNKELNITENLNCVIDSKGNFNNFISEYKGLNYKDANTEVISLLRKNKMLFLDTNAVIMIPRCRKCNHEITYRYLNKWYVKRDENINNELKLAFENLQKRIIYNNENNISTIEKGLNKILTTNELSISNERKSSVPIPAFYCANCGNEIISSLTIDICKNILKEKGIDTWNKMTPEEILGGQVKCHKCDCDFLFKEDSSLNDWFKLLTIPMFNVKIENDKNNKNSQTPNIENNELVNTKNLCIETRKDFFNKIKVISFDLDAVSKINSITNAILHTRVKENVKTIAKPLFLDKSENDFSSNFITTDLGIIDIVKKYGIDVLRLWAVHRSDTPSIKLTEGDIINVRTRYLQFRKTLKYILSNLYDFNPVKDKIPVHERDDLDIYIYSKMQQLEIILDKRYNELNFPAIYRTLYKFCTEILQNNYFEAIKYRLYVTPKTGFYRRSVQSNLYDLIGIFVTYLQPILPLLFEECWPYIFHKSTEEERNILLFRDTEYLEKIELTPEQKNWHKIFMLRSKILPVVNKACNDGVIKTSLEARVIITCSKSDNDFIKENYYDIIRTLNVSVVIFKIGSTLKIEVKKALGVECMKCKNYSTAIGINFKYRHLCKQCANIEESIATNTIPTNKMPKEIYIEEEHKNDDDENINLDTNVPSPPIFDTLDLENVEFDDRLGDKMDENKLKLIEQLNTANTNNKNDKQQEEISESTEYFDEQIPEIDIKENVNNTDNNINTTNNNSLNENTKNPSKKTDLTNESTLEDPFAEPSEYMEESSNTHIKEKNTNNSTTNFDIDIKNNNTNSSEDSNLSNFEDSFRD